MVNVNAMEYSFIVRKHYDLVHTQDILLSDCDKSCHTNKRILHTEMGGV